MGEHRIALRRAWEGQFCTAEGVVARRVDLPTRIDPSWGRFRLDRAFQPPRIDPEKESLFLRLERIAGLVGAWLNDEPVAEAFPSRGPIELAIGIPPPRRCRLTLDVEPPKGATGTDLDDWGHVALVIRWRA
jgi:hypothetical protein